MCGIFGFSYTGKVDYNRYSEFESDINLFTHLSEIRGSDTFGLSLSSQTIIIFIKLTPVP